MGKKERDKKFKSSNERKFPENNQESRRDDIFSKLEKIDTISREESRTTEEKLRRGLIESKTIEREKKSEVKIFEIQQKIERLKNIKLGLYEDGDYEKSMEIAKMIITIAEKNDINIILNEEKKFINATQKKIRPKKPIGEKIEELKKLRYSYYSSEKYEEAIQIAKMLIEFASEANLDETVKIEENFIALLQEKINQKSSKVESFESLKDLELVNQKQPYSPKIKEKSEKDLDTLLSAKQIKIRTDKVKLEEEKENLKVEKREFKSNEESSIGEQRKFIEEREIFKQEKINLEEEIGNFNQEKLMLEEVKKNLNKEKREFESNKEFFMEEQCKFKEEREIFKQEKIILEQEKENFNQIRQMFEEIKKKLL